MSQIHVPPRAAPAGTASSTHTTSLPGNEDGALATPTTHPAGAICKVAVRETAAYVPVITADCVVATLVVATVNVAIVAAAETVTFEATTAAPLSLDRDTITPPAGAGPSRMIVPVEGDPP
ncbi:MAG: hypothetical protein ABI584_15690 [Acidobacteriota bacterium]